ncbi:hypothetical protein HHK36_023780 [Tetracentron sinense]|uniref:Protein kinase domain-containing protein n=1 Tax=Tetracentron sinense TaxID=13715 RepID=A0A834YNT0_TETSI|nr:hypothetical protein HHK36_023780 [Tetracentron sinense]
MFERSSNLICDILVPNSGYMAPEYAMEGQFSVKSDVFSFGVILLEIISGKKTNGFYNSAHGQSLLKFVCFAASLCFQWRKLID